MKSINFNTGDLIRIYRKKAQMSQYELGELINTDQHTISQYECGHRRPQLRILRKLANALNVSERDLWPTWKQENKERPVDSPLSADNIDKTIFSLLMEMNIDEKKQIYYQLHAMQTERKKKNE